MTNVGNDLGGDGCSILVTLGSDPSPLAQDDSLVGGLASSQVVSEDLFEECQRWMPD